MSYNPALLRALAAGEPVSGTALGRRLGISRTAVWKGIHRLGALGLEVAAQPGRGYRLAAPLELLDPERIRAALPSAVAAGLGRLEVVDTIASTNTRVLEADRPVGELVACLAEYQSAGRGRRGRRWLAAPGQSICLSVGGRLAVAPADCAGLAPWAGLACAEALAAAGAGGVALKWPNDLLLDEGKLGGILIELRGEAQGPVTVAVGVGVNLRLAEQARADVLATGGLAPAALGDAVPGVGRNTLAAGLLAALADTLSRLPLESGEALPDAWAPRDALRGRAVRIEGAGQPLAGIARGVDAAGALLLETGDGQLHRVTAGEASLRPAS